MQGGWPLLAALLQRLLSSAIFVPPRAALRRRVVLVDATTLSAPGSEGADWRLHVGYDLAAGRVNSVEVTDAHGGEHLGRFGLVKGDLCIGDRGYAHEKRIAEVLGAGADVLIRIGHLAVPLVDGAERAVDPLAFATRKRARAGRPRRCEGQDVFLRSDTERRWPLRLIVVRKTVAAAKKEERRIEKEARRKGTAITQRSLDSARYAFLLCSIPAKEADSATIADLYRARWQIELLFKRWKSLLGLSNLRADDPDLARAYIYAKLIAAVLSDKIVRQWRAFSPYGVPVGPGRMAHLEAGA
jgi:hypothetical protein